MTHSWIGPRKGQSIAPSGGGIIRVDPLTGGPTVVSPRAGLTMQRRGLIVIVVFGLMRLGPAPAAAGPGGGPHVRALTRNPDGTLTDLASFFAYDPAFTAGFSSPASSRDPPSAPSRRHPGAPDKGGNHA